MAPDGSQQPRHRLVEGLIGAAAIGLRRGRSTIRGMGASIPDQLLALDVDDVAAWLLRKLAVAPPNEVGRNFIVFRLGEWFPGTGGLGPTLVGPTGQPLADTAKRARLERLLEDAYGLLLSRGLIVADPNAGGSFCRLTAAGERRAAQDSDRSSPPVDLGGPDALREVFVCHAGEDKDAVARPLADELRARGRSVWFDEYELCVGDSLRRRIDHGLIHSTVGAVILSRSFFSKEWPQRELDGLTARSVAGETNVIVPVWHNVTIADVRAFSPALADLVAVKTADGIPGVAEEIEKLLNRLAR